MELTKAEKKKIEEEEKYRTELREQEEYRNQVRAELNENPKKGVGCGTVFLIIIVGFFLFLVISLIAINPKGQLEKAQREAQQQSGELRGQR